MSTAIYHSEHKIEDLILIPIPTRHIFAKLFDILTLLRSNNMWCVWCLVFSHLQDSSLRLHGCDNGSRRPSLYCNLILLHLPRYQVSGLHASPHSFHVWRACGWWPETETNEIMISDVIIVVPIYAKSNRRLSDKFRCNGYAEVANLADSKLIVMLCCTLFPQSKIIQHDVNVKNVWCVVICFCCRVV